jgi:hypothetical protein
LEQKYLRWRARYRIGLVAPPDETGGRARNRANYD